MKWLRQCDFLVEKVYIFSNLYCLVSTKRITDLTHPTHTLLHPLCIKNLSLQLPYVLKVIVLQPKVHVEGHDFPTCPSTWQHWCFHPAPTMAFFLHNEWWTSTCYHWVTTSFNGFLVAVKQRFSPCNPCTLWVQYSREYRGSLPWRVAKLYSNFMGNSLFTTSDPRFTWGTGPDGM